jgi:nucleoside-diphosphate-sugar epimerase
MNILVTGATGFVGKRLVQRLTELGHEVQGTYEKEGPKEYKPLELTDEASIKRAVDGSWQWGHTSRWPCREPKRRRRTPQRRGTST